MHDEPWYKELGGLLNERIRIFGSIAIDILLLTGWAFLLNLYYNLTEGIKLHGIELFIFQAANATMSVATFLLILIYTISDLIKVYRRVKHSLDRDHSHDA